MSRAREIAGKVTGKVGYGALSVHGALQWGHTLYTKTTAGLSPYYLIAMAGTLICLQVAFWARRAPRDWQVGNACSLGNALAAIAAYWWVNL